MVRLWRSLTTIFVLCLIAAGQVAPPKHESRLHHLFTPHRDSDNLQQRYEDLRCALVFIQAGNRTGTGFYVSPDGDIVTASHVIGDRSFIHNGAQMLITIPIPNAIVIKTSSAE